MPIAVTIRLYPTAALALLFCAAPALGTDKVKLTEVAVGFPSASAGGARDRADVSRFGAWAPVYATLEVLGDVSEPAELVIEAPDPDEVGTTLAVPIDLAGLAPGTTVFAPDRGALGYVRPAGSGGEITVTVRTAKGVALSEPVRVRAHPREPLQYVVLAVGGAPAGFELPKAAFTTGAPDVGPLRNGRVELAHITDLAHLPDQWFGYTAADLVLLNTGTAPADLLARLFGSDAPADVRKREALLEWTRRGGRLVVSLGANAKPASELPRLQALLPYAIDAAAPVRTKRAVALYWSAGSSSQTSVAVGALDSKGGPPVALANLVPHKTGAKPVRVLSPPPNWKADEPEPVAVQAALGMGRVTVIGFDLDRAPFAEPQQRADFWDWVLRDCGANRASAGGDGKARPAGTLTEDEDDAAVAIRAYNDAFEGVAVVSFGWVALLIVLYILLIGPVEYYFLKRVLGRLELTWATFPIIVLTVSVAAYLSADAIKGRELKVNKIDVVDVDPVTGRIYGTTWFTVFSPRIDNYSITVTPGDGWNDGPEWTEDAVVAGVGAPRGGRPGLVRRRYAIRSDGTHVADGLENVPIQVWSTKAFAATWSSGIGPPGRANSREPGRGPLRDDLTHPPGDPTKVIGTFTHDLPVPALTDCVAFYAGNAYPLPGGVIAKGQRVRLLFDQAVPANQWLQTNGQLRELLDHSQAYRERPGQKAGQRQPLQPLAVAPALPLWGVLFHEGTLKNEENTFARNASLRRLDQSWRLSAENRDEVIVVGRAAPPPGPAEEVLTGPNAAAKLWLKGPPGERRPIPGTARQETWVRFFLPVR
jgi:hypothetical protein